MSAKSWNSIGTSIKPDVKKAIITGSPGMEKSLLFIYLLFKLAKEKKRVVFIYHRFKIYYNEKDVVFRVASDELPADDDYSLWNDTFRCLFDAKLKNEADLGALPYELCTFVLSTYPQREMLNDLKKPIVS